MWEKLSADIYATALRFQATRCEEIARRLAAEPYGWASDGVLHYRAQARRLRAMAIFCDQKPDDLAGAINFQRLDDPNASPEDIGRAVFQAESMIPGGGSL